MSHRITAMITHRQVRHTALILLLLCCATLLAWLGNHYHISYDWTQNQRNSLSAASVKILHAMHGPIQIQAYVPQQAQLQTSITRLIARYQRHYPHMSLRFIDPARQPQHSLKLDIHPEGEMVISYAGKQEKLRTLDEQSISTTLLGLSHTRETWIAFTEGHGERSPHQQGNRDLNQFAHQLQRHGTHIQTIDLSTLQGIPDNTDAVVIADPRTPFSANEIALINDFVARGGGLLWLQEPVDADSEPTGLTSLARQLGIRFLPGMVISANTPRLGIRNPGIIIAEHQHNPHAITRDLGQRTLFPYSGGIEAVTGSEWEATSIVQSDRSSWTETSALDSPPLRFDVDSEERAGPITLALALTRTLTTAASATQRIAVVGDADFISNAFIANGSNQALGNNLIYWLAHQERFIELQPPQAQDRLLVIEEWQTMLYAFVFPFILPALLLTSGLLIQRRRQRR